jgi:DNA-directed RNA polymerase subunit RPC12/RpoP
MATQVIKKCDRCGKFVDNSTENRQYSYEENGEKYAVNSFRIGNWNAKEKRWDSIVSAYDLCYDCGKEVTEAVFDVLHGDKDCILTTRVSPKIVKKGAADESNGSV